MSLLTIAYNAALHKIRNVLVALDAYRVIEPQKVSPIEQEVAKISPNLVRFSAMIRPEQNRKCRSEALIVPTVWSPKQSNKECPRDPIDQPIS